MKTAKQILIEAKGLVGEGWTQGTYVRPPLYGGVHPLYCASGALRLVCDQLGGSAEVSAAWSALQCAMGGSGIACWNDDPKRTHGEVLAAFDRAIELVSEEP